MYFSNIGKNFNVAASSREKEEKTENSRFFVTNAKEGETEIRLYGLTGK